MSGRPAAIRFFFSGSRQGRQVGFAALCLGTYGALGDGEELFLMIQASLYQILPTLNLKRFYEKGHREKLDGGFD